MKAAKSSETLASYHNPEDIDLNLYPSPTPFTLKMEAARSSETLASYHITTRHNAEDIDLIPKIIVCIM
jgi:hypothetical protein